MVDLRFTILELIIYLTSWAICAASIGYMLHRETSVLIRGETLADLDMPIAVPILILMPGALVGGSLGFFVRGRKWFISGTVTGFFLWLVFVASQLAI